MESAKQKQMPAVTSSSSSSSSGPRSDRSDIRCVVCGGANANPSTNRSRSKNGRHNNLYAAHCCCWGRVSIQLFKSTNLAGPIPQTPHHLCPLDGGISAATAAGAAAAAVVTVRSSSASSGGMSRSSGGTGLWGRRCRSGLKQGGATSGGIWLLPVLCTWRVRIRGRG